MPFDKALAYDFLKAICFERVAGTPEEDKAVDLIRAAVEKTGTVATVECFDFRTFTAGRAGLEILSPYKKRYPAMPVGNSGSFPKGGRVLPLVYAGVTSPEAVGDLDGKAVYGYEISGRERFEQYRNAGVAALVRVIDFGRSLRCGFVLERFLKRCGRIPQITIPYEAGAEMVQRGAARARIELEQGEKTATGKNVVAVVGGTAPAIDEEIVICGHHDSVPGSPGANDNGTGCAVMVALLSHFAANPTRRALRFLWFGGEELGMLGSEAYVDTHENELPRVRMVVNIDGAGRLLDPVYAYANGPAGLRYFVETIGREHGVNYSVTEMALSSDNIPFSWHEISSISLSSGSDHNLIYHTENDALQWHNPEALEANGEIALEIIQRLGNARQFPFRKGFNEAAGKSLKEFYTQGLYDMPLWCR